MKTNKEKLPAAGCGLPIEQPSAASFATAIENQKSKSEKRAAFTLIELLVVIAIMAILAAFTFPVLGALKRQQYVKTATAEMEQIKTALDNYKNKYGVYPPGNAKDPMLSQLYYELSGTTNNNNGYYVTLDGSSQIPVGQVSQAYGVGGFVNCSQGSGEDAKLARNFLSGLSSKEIYNLVTNMSWGYQIPTTMLVTSVGGPDVAYQPLNASGLNPFRYTYPGTNNPGSYDLWIDLRISGKTNRICNWKTGVFSLN
jgi:prepilin-type N-terminal cleavage/methylation domain-containing protein